MDRAIRQWETLALRLTPQRRAILEVLQKNAGRHLSAEEIYDLVRAQKPGIGLATIYRTLDILVEGALAHRLDFGDGKARYELARQEEHHHHHLVCVECGQIIEVKDDLLQRLEEMVEQENSFTIMDHHLKFFGYCSRCEGMHPPKR